MAIYELSCASNAPCAEWDNSKNDLAVVFCPLEDGHRHTTDRLSDLNIILPSPKIYDLMQTWYSEWMISDRTAEIFAEAKLTGYTLGPVHVHGYKRGPKTASIPRLHELIITGVGGVARPESGVRFLSRCPGCNILKFTSCTNLSQAFNPEQWDESDFFRIYPLGMRVFVTERVRQVLKKYKLKYAKCATLPEYEKPCLPTTSARPLSEEFPEPMASEYGKPLGIY